jgi:pimeloyl-ACP methyl ester carboxylesterase
LTAGTDARGVEEVPTTVRSKDGLKLAASLVLPTGGASSVTVLVHGGGVTRHEGGFFTRLAEGMAARGVASLRFDLRGHGDSEGRQEDLTIASILNDIHTAIRHARDLTDDVPANLLGASFGGGICGYFAAQHPQLVRRLVLINPLINYKKRFVDDKPYWTDDRIDEPAAQELSANGFLRHSPTFKLGRPILNEVFYLPPDCAFGKIASPTLMIHGTKDTFIPVSSSREHVSLIPGDATLLEIEGAQHGIAVHDDPEYRQPQTQQWQTQVIASISEWLS